MRRPKKAKFAPKPRIVVDPISQAVDKYQRDVLRLAIRTLDDGALSIFLNNQLIQWERELGRADPLPYAARVIDLLRAALEMHKSALRDKIATAEAVLAGEAA